MQFYPGDWWKDTRRLSLAAKGAWIDLICAMWDAQNRGVITDTIEGYSRLFGCTVDQAGRAIDEITDPNIRVCNRKNLPDERIRLTSRRMVREELDRREEREDNRERKRRQRAKDKSERGYGASEPDEQSRKCHADVTAMSRRSSSSSSSSTSLSEGEGVGEGSGRSKKPDPEALKAELKRRRNAREPCPTASGSAKT